MSSKKKIKVGIVVGEHSGDNLGSEIIKNLKKHNNIALYGVAGPKVISEGLDSLFDFTNLQIMGLVDPLLNILKLKRFQKKLTELFLKEKIDIFIGVDSPDFNNNIYKNLKKSSSIKTIQVVSPSVWGWRQGRIKNIKKYIDLVVCLFHFEDDFFKQRSINSIHLGHHFAKLEKNDTKSVLKKHNLDSKKEFITIMPGSRNSEIKYLLPIYLDFVKKHYKLNKNTQYLIPAANDDQFYSIKNKLSGLNYPIKLGLNCSSEFLSISNSSVVTSGTATLESAILECAPVICYKTNNFNYVIISNMLKIDFVGLPNLLLGKVHFPELIQNRCTSNNILNALEELKNVDHDKTFANLKRGLSGLGLDDVSKEILDL